ncbi:MFS transporter [Lederbergia panacisoli]|uniref:MFS transporter n=1 Tax=Lederbergia panacisoli TaxID=1255251 RepID=UPI00214CAAB0|nr:MFS transporter [Lederbergia panacisoli]MCR2821670.1 MFS transporter [Lederbergia panacisoli]
MERLWTKSFILMILGTLFLFIGFYMLYPTLPIYIKQIGGNESQVGLAMGTFMLSAVLIRPIIGGLLDRFGRRPFIVCGLLFFSLFMYLYEWTSAVLLLLGLRVLHGMTWGVTTTAMTTAITDMIPSNRRGEGFGWSGMAMTLAMAIGPMFGLWISDNLSFQSLFFISAALSVVALTMTFGAKMPFQPKKAAGRMEMFGKSVMPVAASVFFLFIAYGGITTFIPLFAHSLHVNSGLFFLVYSATLFLIRPFAGKLSDLKGESFVIVPSLFVTIIALITLSLSTGLLGILASAVLYGIGFGSAQPALQAAMLRFVQPERMGVANATFSTAIDLGIGLGAIILGWVSQFWNYRLLFTVSAMSVACSLVLFFFLVVRLSNKKKSSMDVQSS